MTAATIRLRPAGVRLRGDHGRHHVADADVRAVRRADALRGADHDRHLRDVCGRRAVRAAGVRAVVATRSAGGRCCWPACVFALASAAVFLVAHSVPMLLVGRVLSGLSAGIFTGTATAAVIEAAPESWRTRAAAVATVANIGGLGIGPLLAGSAGAVRARTPAPEFHRAHRARSCWRGRRCCSPRKPPQRTGSIGVQRLSVPAAGPCRFSSSPPSRRSQGSR